MDAFIVAREDLKNIINKVGDSRNLPTGWFNQDFKHTNSYTPNIRQYSKYYATFSHCMEVRTIKDEYMIAMKLVSFRPYKHDRSDIIGVLVEKQKEGHPISYEDINKAMINLYGDWNKVSTEAKNTLDMILKAPDLRNLYEEVKNFERNNLNSLMEFENNYPGVLSEENLDDVLISKQKEKIISIDELIQNAERKLNQVSNNKSKKNQIYEYHEMEP